MTSLKDVHPAISEAFKNLAMGISEEIKDAKITTEKIEDLKIEAKI